MITCFLSLCKVVGQLRKWPGSSKEPENMTTHRSHLMASLILSLLHLAPRPLGLFFLFGTIDCSLICQPRQGQLGHIKAVSPCIERLSGFSASLFASAMDLKDVEPTAWSAEVDGRHLSLPVIVGSELHKVVEEVRVSILIAALLDVLFTHKVVVGVLLLPFQLLPLFPLSLLGGFLLLSDSSFFSSLLLQVLFLLCHEIRKLLDARLVQPVDNLVLASRNKDPFRQFRIMERYLACCHGSILHEI